MLTPLGCWALLLSATVSGFAFVVGLATPGLSWGWSVGLLAAAFVLHVTTSVIFLAELTGD